jgi:triosephosphate isomerase
MSNKNERVVIANWKMKLGLKESVELAKDLKEKFTEFKQGGVAVCPSTFALTEVKKVLKGSNIKLGAQNVFWEEKGAFTSETPVSALEEMGCQYVILGHSERRQYMHENYEMINRKLKAVLNHSTITPIVCIGENWEERKTDRRDFVLTHQLQHALGGLNLLPDQQVIVAYEPIWAIGSGTAIEPVEAEYAHRVIRLTLKDILGSSVSTDNFKVIYGGSITSKNVKEFANLENIDGLLVGGASLNAAEFYKVAKAMLK